MAKRINIDDIDIQDIYAFMENGSVTNAPAEIVYYLELLDKTNGLQRRIRQYGTREAVIKHLMITEDLSRYKASVIYDETLEYFYRSESISKAAWRNIYAEKIDNLITAATLSAKSTEDFDRITRMQLRAAKIRQLDVPEPPVIPKELFDKPIKIYAMDPEFLGEEKINRLELARQIDEFEEFTIVEKNLLKQDAAIIPIKLFDNDQEIHRRPE